MRAHPKDLPYSGSWLDRAANERIDPAAIRATLAHPDTRVVPLWRDRCLLAGRPPTPLSLVAASAGDALAAAGQRVFLGRTDRGAHFAIDLSALPEPRALELCGAVASTDIRTVVGAVDAATAAILACARGLLHWHRSQQFCGACGSATDSCRAGHARTCRRAGCDALLFPRIEPAVIALVEAPDGSGRCLLARHRGAADGAFALLAGFVEVGESLEDAVRREVAEEVGVQVDRVIYQASQAWPFPAGLMIGFRARASSAQVTVDRDELVEARWFSRAEVRALLSARGDRSIFNDDSIERYLIGAWLAESAAADADQSAR
ncbi:MAG: NAD(+) diphosphatase [Myxococcota bacterium]